MAETEKTTTTATVPVEQPKPAVKTVVVQQPVVLMGYCDTCHKPLYKKEDYVVERSGRGGHIQHVYCKDCKKRSDDAKLAARKAKTAKMRKIGFLCGALAAAIFFGVIMFLQFEKAGWVVALIESLVGAYAGFAFTSQMIWCNGVMECFSFFAGWSIKLPGVIFTLDLDGIFFLLTVKLVGAIISIGIGLIGLILGFIVSAAYAMFSFPFAVGAQARGEYTD